MILWMLEMWSLVSFVYALTENVQRLLMFESAFRTSQPSMRQLQASLLTKYNTSDGSDLNGSRLTVQFARGSRQRDTFAQPDRTHPRPRRTAYRMQITGLPGETSWQVS